MGLEDGLNGVSYAGNEASEHHEVVGVAAAEAVLPFHI